MAVHCARAPCVCDGSHVLGIPTFLPYSPASSVVSRELGGGGGGGGEEGVRGGGGGADG